MGSIVKTSAFKTGNSVAVRFPKSFGIRPGDALELVQGPHNVEVRRVIDPDTERAKVLELVRRLDELGPVEGAERARDDGRIEFPDRPGLY